MSTVELRQIIGETRIKNEVVRLKHDMDILLLNGRQIATINHVPGAAIKLLPGTVLTPSEEKAVVEEIAKARGGVHPKQIFGNITLPGELVEDETELDCE